MQNTYSLTREGKIKLEKELRELIDVIMPEVVDQIAAARSQGDLSENADYDAARNKQAELVARVSEIEYILSHSQVVESSPNNDKLVGLGSIVTVVDVDDPNARERVYKIVGTIEADPLNDTLSDVSPLGKALSGKMVGDIVSFTTSKVKTFKIVKIETSI